MARMPGADYRPLSLHGGAMRAHDIACIHTMCGSLWGTDAYFRSGVANSHFGTGGDGHLVQWLDTATESWANLDGNPNVISCENADMGPEFAPWTGSDVPEFTAAQVETLAQWLAWVCSPAAHADCPPSWTCHTEGIPLELIPDDRPGRRGVGYHRHGIDNWRVPTGVLWSSHPGKVCPGDRRIAQVPQIIARAAELSAGPTQEEIDVEKYVLLIGIGTTVYKVNYLRGEAAPVNPAQLTFLRGLGWPEKGGQGGGVISGLVDPGDGKVWGSPDKTA